MRWFFPKPKIVRYRTRKGGRGRVFLSTGVGVVVAAVKSSRQGLLARAGVRVPGLSLEESRDGVGHLRVSFHHSFLPSCARMDRRGRLSLHGRWVAEVYGAASTRFFAPFLFAIDHAGFHHESDFAENGDVFERVAGDRDDVGVVVGF